MQREVRETRQPSRVRRDVGVIGASAGGVEALTAFARGLPADIPMAFVVVLHMPAGADSRLPEILGRGGPLPATFAEDGGTPRAGTFQVAPPDHHLVFSGDRLHLLDGPRENGFRPAIDPLFRSAARDLGPRAVGMILSGTMDDGALGLAAIQSFGGETVVQDPEDALASGMPRAAMDAIVPGHVVPAAEMGRLLSEIVAGEVPAMAEGTGSKLHAVGRGRTVQPRDPTLVAEPMQLPPRGVDLACPECGGALQEVLAGGLSRFRCRTGHIYSAGTLLDTKSIELEGALWAALRALEEEATVAGRLVARSRDLGATAAVRRFEARQGDAAARADLVRQALHEIGKEPGEPGTEPEPLFLGQRHVSQG